MPKKYEAGTRKQIIGMMAYDAMRDQKALLEAITPEFGEPDSDTQETIQEIEARIRDYGRLRKVLMGNEPL